ncbi:MAG: alcohol dehydrogenase catalytic domain-containing protein [Gemmatimonadaceae bacterium]|nr:alcohol dehydrogenase catalytic domain-containing protein [Gemmatimonadaceae bacterium]
MLTEFGSPLQVRDLPRPEATPESAVVRVEACGICRSDWHAWRGDWPSVEPPRVLGHELGGVVEEVGAGVRSFQAGDRVTSPFHQACGRCGHCYGGRSNICKANGVIGITFDGGYGRYVRVPEADVNLVRLPEEVDFLGAAALGCRFMTAWHGLVDRARVVPGEWVAVFGAGGIGLSAVQIASALGARVIAVDIDEGKLVRAREEGAVAGVDAGSCDAAEAVRDLSGGGADLSLDALGSSKTARPALASLRKGARHLQIGMSTPEEEAEEGHLALPVDDMIRDEISFVTSLGCPTTSYPGLLALVAEGRLDPARLVSATVSVDAAGGVLAEMTGFGTLGFTVIDTW